MDSSYEARCAWERGDLERAAELLKREAFARPGDGWLQLELEIVVKLLGRIELAFSLLERALELIPSEDRLSRQCARFVLGLTWGDVGRFERAVESFEAAAREDCASPQAEAALYYAAAYRELHGL